MNCCDLSFIYGIHYYTYYGVMGKVEQTCMGSTVDIKKTPFLKKSERDIEVDILSLQDIRKLLPVKGSGVFERLDFYLLVHFTAGTGNHFVDFCSYPYQKGATFFVSKYQVQQWDVFDDTEGFLILFTEEFFSTNDMDRTILLDLEITTQQKAPLLPTDTEHFVANSLSALLHEFKQPKDFVKDEMLRSLLRVMLLHILRTASAVVETRNRSESQFLQFRRLLEANLYKKWSVSDFAAQIGVGPKRLNTLIKEQSGKTAKEFIDTRLALEAKRLLTTICSTTKEAAFTLNFDEPSNFVKFFKRTCGETPSQFQKRISQ